MSSLPGDRSASGRHRPQHRRQDGRAEDARAVRADGAERHADPRRRGRAAAVLRRDVHRRRRRAERRAQPLHLLRPHRQPLRDRSPPTARAPAGPARRARRRHRSGGRRGAGDRVCIAVASTRAGARLAITTHYTPVKLFALETPALRGGGGRLRRRDADAALSARLRLARAQPGAADRAPARSSRSRSWQRRESAQLGASARLLAAALEQLERSRRRARRRNSPRPPRARRKLAAQDAESDAPGQRAARAAPHRLGARSCARRAPSCARSKSRGAPSLTALRADDRARELERFSARAGGGDRGAGSAALDRAAMPGGDRSGRRCGRAIMVEVGDRGIHGELLRDRRRAGLDPARHDALRGSGGAAAPARHGAAPAPLTAVAHVVPRRARRARAQPDRPARARSGRPSSSASSTAPSQAAQTPCASSTGSAAAPCAAPCTTIWPPRRTAPRSAAARRRGRGGVTVVEVNV